MGVENANGIHELDADAPLGTESISEGDNHIRVIKHAIKKTFPNVEGEVTASHTDLNNIGDTSQAIDDLEADVTKLNTDFNTLETTVNDVIANKYEGNVASCYYNPAFGAGALVYQHNVTSVTNDGNGITRVSYSTLLDGIGGGSNDTGHYSVSLTPVTLTGKPVIIVLYGSVRSHLTFKAYELESNMTTWTEIAGAACSFHLTIIDMFEGQP